MVVSSTYSTLTVISFCVCPFVSILVRCGVPCLLLVELVSVYCRWLIPGSGRRVLMKFRALVSKVIEVIVAFVRLFVNRIGRFDCCGNG